MSLLMFDAARFEDDDELLDQAVDLGTVALLSGRTIVAAATAHS